MPDFVENIMNGMNASNMHIIQLPDKDFAYFSVIEVQKTTMITPKVG